MMEDTDETLPGPPAEHMGRAQGLKPSPLLVRFGALFTEAGMPGPVIDLACGFGDNGIHLAILGVPVILIDRSASRLAQARKTARRLGVGIHTKVQDLERPASNPLAGISPAGIVVFKYLHRPLISLIKECLPVGGLLIYETFTLGQRQYGRPRNPDFLLKPGELQSWFGGWELIHHFEGETGPPRQAIAQIVCRKSAGAQIGSPDVLQKGNKVLYVSPELTGVDLRLREKLRAL